MSDETYYLYFSNNFDSNVYLTTAFGVLNKFFCFGSPTLIHLRLAKFIYQSLAVIVFAISLLKYLKFKQIKLDTSSRFIFVSILLLCSYINYDYLPMTISYNTWSLILSLLGVAVIFYEKTKPEMKTYFIGSLLFGTICFALLLAKFPNAAVLFLLYIVLSFKCTKAELLIKAIGLLCGVLLGFIIFLHSFEALKGILTNYWLTISEVKHDPVHPYSEQLKNFLSMCWEKNYLAGEIGLIFLAILIKRINSKLETYGFYLLLAINYGLMFLFRKGNGTELYNDFMAGCLILINMALYVYMFGKQRSGLENTLVWCLLLMPFGLMFGTNNEFYYTVSQLMVFAVAGMLLFLAATGNGFVFSGITAVVISFFVVNVLYSGAVKNPYRQSNLDEKTYPLNFSSEIKGVLESKKRMIDYMVLNEALKKLNTSQKPVMGFFSHFGMHYLNGCKVFPESQITDNGKLMYINDYLLNRYGPPNDCDLVVMSRKTSVSVEFIDMFKRNGIVLDGNFKKVFTYKFLSTGEETLIYKRI